MKTWPMVAAALCWAALAGAQLRTFTLGQGGRPWAGGGGGVDPEILISGGVDTTNAPGGAIDFVHRPGWISPLRFDEEENIAGRVLMKGGSITSPNSLLESRAVLNKQLAGTVNGDHKVAFERKPTPFNPEANARGIWVILDFGVPVGVHRVRFYPRNTVFPDAAVPFQDDFLRGYELYVNEQLTNTAQNAPDLLVARDPENENPVVDLEVPAQFARLVKLRSLAETPFELDEVEVYGTGFLAGATYLTDLIDLGDRATVGPVRWQEEVVGEPARSSVGVRVRTGSDDSPILYRRQGVGEFGDAFVIEVSGAEYHQLERAARAPLLEDTQHWSPWKTVQNGALAGAPGPRRFIQFSADFAGALYDARQLGQLQFDYLQPPIGDTLRAEVFPRLARAEEPATFRYAVRLRTAGPVRGFDRLEVDTSVPVTAVRQVRLQGRPVEFIADLDHPDFFRLDFPLVREDGAVLEFTFDLPIFRFGTTFSGRAYHHSFPGVPQRLEAGEAVDFGPGDVPELSGLSVAIPQSQVGKLVGEISLSSRVLTPNGDGVNDAVEMGFNLLQLTRPTPVAWEIHDLAGRRVHTVFAEERRIGPATYRWDGRAAGGLLPPGNYVWVLRVEADAFEERHTGVIAVVY
jgi:hypothetical protein